MKGWQVNAELERMWREAVVAGIFLEVLIKTKNYLCQDSRSPGRDMNSGPPVYEAGMLNT
jgi:hypothetical protein